VVSPAKAAVAAVAAAATTLRGQVVHWSAAPARRLLNVAVQPRRSLIEVDDAADGAAAAGALPRRVKICAQIECKRQGRRSLPSQFKQTIIARFSPAGINSC
jgi:hypothetical protein